MVSVDDVDEVEAQPVADLPVYEHLEVINDNDISNDVVEAVTHYLRRHYQIQRLPTMEDFCWLAVREHIRVQRGGVDRMGYIYDDPDLIMTSSNYAIACEELGLILDPDMVAYTAGRSGTWIYLDEHNWIDGEFPRNYRDRKYVTFRDVIQVLRIIVG